MYRHPCPAALRRGFVVLALGAVAMQAQAQTASAVATLSNVRIEVVDLLPDDGLWPWVSVISNVDWVPLSSSTTAEVGDPALGQAWSGWLGSAQQSQAVLGSAQATASLGAGDLYSGVGGSASASAAGGLSGWAITQLFGGRILAGAGTRVVVTAQVDALSASSGGGWAQAVASLGIANETGGQFDESQAWVFDAPDFNSSHLPSTLSVHWDNTSHDAVWGQLLVTASAQVSAVPEPGPAAMLALGLAALALRRGLQVRRDA